MYKNRILAVFLFLLAVTTGTAQLFTKNSNKDSEFNDALHDYKQERYEAAMSKFSKILRDNVIPDRSLYAHFYYASAAERLNKNKEAWDALQSLLSKFPNWNQKDEAYYLAALVQFKMENYNRGLDYLHRISTSAFQKDVAGLKQHYLAQITQLDVLKGLHRQYPNDRVLASYLIRAVRTSPSPSRSDLEMIKALGSRFKLTQEEMPARLPEKRDDKKITRPDRQAKNHFDIAVLLPFRIDQFDPSTRNRSNQYVFDYYQGLLLAQRQLRKENIDVRINAFDIGNTVSSVERLAETEEFRSSDLILGPLHTETSEEAAEYSRKTGVPVLNPLSTDSKLLSKKYPHYFLAHPSLELQARQAALTAKSISSEIRALIYWGDSQKDSTLAELYAAEIKKMGGIVLAMEKTGVTPETIGQVMGKNNYSAPSHIVFFSTDARAGRNFLSLIRGSAFEQTPVIATATAFDRYNTDFNGYRRDIYLIDTDYIDYEQNEVKQFQYDYYMANNTLPSVYSYQGYDHLLFLGRKLSRYKDKIGEGLSQTRYSDRQGYFLGGFDFSDARENSVFSIRKLQGNQWISIEGMVGN